MELAFSSAKIFEVLSEAEIVGKLEMDLGVPVTHLLGSYNVENSWYESINNSKRQRKRLSRNSSNRCWGASKTRYRSISKTKSKRRNNNGNENIIKTTRKTEQNNRGRRKITMEAEVK